MGTGEMCQLDDEEKAVGDSAAKDRREVDAEAGVSFSL